MRSTPSSFTAGPTRLTVESPSRHRSNRLQKCARTAAPSPCRRPIRIAQQFAGNDDGVGLAGGDDMFCLYRRGNHPHGAG